MSEKKFKIGQKVRIVGPSFFGIELGVGKCFVIGDIITRDGKSVYCDIDRGIGWLASSLELAERESDSTEQRLKTLDFVEVVRCKFRGPACPDFVVYPVAHFPGDEAFLEGKEKESNPSLTGHPIEEVKRTPPEECQNVEGARLDLSGEFTALRSVKLGGALDGCGLSVGPEREPSKHSPEDERILPKRERMKMELESIRVVIGILKQREQELLAEYDKLMEAA
jgi:hypothetical protein